MAYRSCRVNNHDLQLFTDASEGTGLRSLFGGSWEGSVLTSQVGEAKQQSKHPSLGAAFHWGWHLRLGRSQVPQEKPLVLQAINKSTRSVINPERGEGSDVGVPMRTHEHIHTCGTHCRERGPFAPSLPFRWFRCSRVFLGCLLRLGTLTIAGWILGWSHYMFYKKVWAKNKAKWCFSLKYYY